MAMPDAVEAARTLVRELEFKLRELIGQATTNGQYEEVSQLALLTNQVGSLLSSSANSSGATDGRSRNSGTPSGDKARQPRSARKRVSSRAADYPLFYRQGDSLVKVGWSRSTKSEYTHRVSKPGIDTLVKFLASRRSNQFPISVDTMVDALKNDEQSRILGYQVYVAVAWLKEEGWLAANGRHGYTLRRAKGIPPETIVEQMWANLPTDSAG